VWFIYPSIAILRVDEAWQQSVLQGSDFRAGIEKCFHFEMIIAF